MATGPNAKRAWKLLLNHKDPAEVFDLAIYGAYIAGHLGADIPTEESREVFEHLKTLLASKK